MFTSIYIRPGEVLGITRFSHQAGQAGPGRARQGQAGPGRAMQGQAGPGRRAAWVGQPAVYSVVFAFLSIILPFRSALV